MRIRRAIITIALVLCVVDAAAADLLGSSTLDPPRVAALAVSPVEAVPPTPPTTLPFPTYAPTAHLSPVITTTPTASRGAAALAPLEASIVPAVTTPAATAPVTALATPSVIAAAPAPPPETVARVRGRQINVYSSPTDQRAAFALLGTTEWGNPRVFLTTAHEGAWVRVMIPLPPNGSEGWVREQDVQLSMVSDRIDVSLAARTLTWSRAGQLMLETVVSIGAPTSPTTPGRFFVTDLVPEDPRGPYGSWALALSGYSEAFATFNGGLPRLAIHGTDAPSSIGNAASNGCLRVAAEPLAELAAGVPVGTPVVVS